MNGVKKHITAQIKHQWRSPLLPLTALTILTGSKWIVSSTSIALALPNESRGDRPLTIVEPLNLDPAIIDNSPVLQRWQEEVPNILSDINHDPSFRTRIRLGYTTTTANHDPGILVGVEDIFLGQTALTLSGDYHPRLSNAEEQYGADLRYYLLPLGRRVNIAPIVGYRSVSIDQNDTDGINVGLKVMLIPSRTGAADLSLSQTWVNPGSDRQAISRFTLSAGYAINQNFRLSSDLHIQTSEQEQNTEVGIFMEWLP